ncbi:twocomponent hybrid sensor and regulator kinase [Acanthamoeba castellanii str. Neff]|uniref:histidine kinase n=1 Tax=Acanthamoeba castellanii (strain ATCC 30010 / Neff) TaxID=1257118 RepID=L8GQL7_ACACF|nr:twocomponent hybrid sensor and regulator kinase [Acanthamoeba castellanii str. Neff]ELR14948.1 twocomponent hybrid sensor and regulator kinase [Acanthamoeba castellanii str. Neff]
MEDEGGGSHDVEAHPLGEEPPADRWEYLSSPKWGYIISAALPSALLLFFVAIIFGVGSGRHGSPTVTFLLSYSDALIALSYFFIPGAIFTVVLKRGDIDRNVWTVWMFGAFIVCCGLTHLVSALCIWFNLGMKVVTAGISYATAIAVYKLIPLALAIPSPIQLEKEINERKDAQRKLQTQYKRSVVLSRVTKEIRRSLKLQDISNATAAQCIDVFDADVCSVYRCDPNPSHGLETSPLEGTSPDDTDHRAVPEGKGKDKEGNDVPNNRGQTHCQPYKWRLLSEYDRWAPDSPKTDKQACSDAEVPMLHLLPGLPEGNTAMVIDFERKEQLTCAPAKLSGVALDESLVNYYRQRRIRSLLCVSVPYQRDSYAVIVLQLRHGSTGRAADDWHLDDIILLQEVITQVAIGLEHAYLLCQANKGRKLAWRNLALERAKEKAEQNSQAKSEFLAVVSHEIRTPMNAICGMTKVLKGSHISREQRDCVQIISSSAKALLSLLNNILDFSKIEAGKTEIHQCPFDLYKCIRNLMGLMSNYTTGRHQKVTLSTLIDPTVPSFVIGDKQHLRQVLINLLSNALKFTPEGSITLRVLTNSTWETSDKEKYAQLHFEVTDTGIGIPHEKQSRLFRPFSQVDSSATRKYEGTGLGLVISKRLCELMGGHMEVHSEEGKGSMFTFTIRVKLQGAVPDYDKCCQLEKNDRRNDARQMAEQILPELQMRTALGALDAAEAQPGAIARPNSPVTNEAAASSSSSSSPSAAPAASDSTTLAPAHSSVFLYNNLNEAARRHIHPQHTHSLPTRLRPITPLPYTPMDSPRLPGTQHYPPPHPEPATGGPRRYSMAVTPKDPVRHSDQYPVIDRILLAEDNTINQKVACKLLSRIGHTQVAAVDAVREANAEGKPFSVILMDLHMPEMDGITASRMIKQEEQERSGTTRPPPYIIACTADLQYGTRKECRQAGMDGYLPKPIKLKELSRVLVHAQMTMLQQKTGLLDDQTAQEPDTASE